MSPKALFVALILGTIFPALSTEAADTAASTDDQIENLAAFARVYGYVRFFYPGDEAAEIDWDKVAVVGAEEVRPAATSAALRERLLRVFHPLAPRLEIGAGGDSASEDSAAKSSESEGLTFWQYRGLNLTNGQGPYRQRRILAGTHAKDRAPLFKPVIAPPPIAKQLPRGLTLRMPTALRTQRDGRTIAARAGDAAALRARLAALDPAALTAGDWRGRVAGIVSVWNVFQHFHPYLDEVGIQWEDVLRPALRRALREQTAGDHYATLSEMVAATRDGHGFIYGGAQYDGGLPVLVTMAEEKIVVTAVADDAPLQRGDIIERVDGVAALEVLRERERYTAGSPHLRQFRALNQFGDGPAGRPARLEIMRDATRLDVTVPRTAPRRGFFFKPIEEKAFQGFAEVRPGIYYVNLMGLSPADYATKLPQLAKARGVIFDWRWSGRAIDHPKPISVTAEVLPHLIDQKIQASPMLTPQITEPDRANWSYMESTWPVTPKSPRFKGRIVFINQASVVSYGETCTAMIADYRLATLVGTPTAGCNGNASYLPLPGGWRVMWTAMDVRKHDRTSFYGVGFAPDIPVARTVRGIKERRDEVLEEAISFLERETQPPTKS